MNPLFKEYQSKPITRFAYEIKEGDHVEPIDDSTSRILGVVVQFKHYEPVSVGDFIVYLDKGDVYHVRRSVFLERNIV